MHVCCFCFLSWSSSVSVSVGRLVTLCVFGSEQKLMIWLPVCAPAGRLLSQGLVNNRSHTNTQSRLDRIACVHSRPLVLAHWGQSVPAAIRLSAMGGVDCCLSRVCAWGLGGIGMCGLLVCVHDCRPSLSSFITLWASRLISVDRSGCVAASRLRLHGLQGDCFVCQSGIFIAVFCFVFFKCPCDNSRQGSWMCESVWHHLQGWLKFIQIRYSENHLLKSAQHAKLRLSFRVYFHIVKFTFVFPLKLTVPNSRQTLAGAGFQCLCENAH